MNNNLNKNFWNKKKVFITGHTGFKGSWLCLFLHYLGAEVTGYSLTPNTKPNLFGLAKVDQIIKKSIIADVRDYKKLLTKIKESNASIIFHLAAQPLVRMSYLHPKNTFDINFTGSLNILQAIKKIKKITTGIIITTDKSMILKKIKFLKKQISLVVWILIALLKFALRFCSVLTINLFSQKVKKWLQPLGQEMS